MGRAVSGTKTREERLGGKGPKRILAIDAGGARTILSAALLGSIEARLRREKDDPDLRLWDHFDLIGGVSSGAFLAGALCAGASVEEACGLLEEAGPGADTPLRGDAVRRPKFELSRLIQTLNEAFGDAPIGDPRIRTGFAAVVKPLEDGPPEIWSNAPNSPSAQRTFQEVILASLGGDCQFDGRGGFADAAIAAPCPAWPLLRYAISPRGLGWATGASKISLVSLGAGRLRPNLPARVFDGPIDPNPNALAASVATRAGYALESALFDAADEALAAMSEVLTPEGSPRTGALASFTRLDVDLTQQSLTDLGLSAGEIQAATERRPATAATLALWRRIGERAALSAPGRVSVGSGPDGDAKPAEEPASEATEAKSEDAAGPHADTAAARPGAKPPRKPRSRLEALSGILGGRSPGPKS